MKAAAALAACLCAAALLLPASHATLTGDEDFGSDVSGLFYVFANRTIHVVNPLTLSVVANITTDQSGNALTNAANASRTWNDGAFVENRTAGLRYIFINEGDLYTENGGASQYGYVSVINARNNTIIARARVGARPVHIYSVNQTATAWVHSDAEGIFYLFPVNATSNLTNPIKVPAFVDKPGHGKLVINSALYPIGYASNVAEPIMPKFNLSNNTRIGNAQFNTSLANATACPGTHTIVYSRVNKHIYAECTSNGGVLEWNTVNDTLVKLHSSAVGVITGSPADDAIFVASQTGSSALILSPGANGQPSTVFASLSIPGNPNYPAFYSNSSTLSKPDNWTSYTVFFPLTRNTNVNNIKAAGADNVTTLAYMTKPSDCQYSNAAVSASSVGGSSSTAGGLLLATSNGAVATPQCGACAPGINSSDPTQFNASLSGFGVLDLGTYSAGPKNTSTTLLPAGATRVAQNFASGANQCAFTTGASRTIRRGGSFIATVADFPQPSIYILDASLPEDALYGRGYVPTAERPTKLVWAPTSAL